MQPARSSFRVCVCMSNRNLRKSLARSGNTTTQEWCGRKQKTQDQSRTEILRKLLTNLAIIDEKATKIAEKSTKIRSRAVLGAQSRFGDVPGRALAADGTAKRRPKTALGMPRARQMHPMSVQRRALAGPGTPPERPKPASEHDCSIERSRACSQTEFLSFLFCRAEAPMCQKCSSCQCFVHFARN